MIYFSALKNFIKCHFVTLLFDAFHMSKVKAFWRDKIVKFLKGDGSGFCDPTQKRISYPPPPDPRISNTLLTGPDGQRLSDSLLIYRPTIQSFSSKSMFELDYPPLD